MVHDGRSWLTAGHYPLERQYGELARRDTEAAHQRCAIAYMLRHTDYPDN